MEKEVTTPCVFLNVRLGLLGKCLWGGTKLLGTVKWYSNDHKEPQPETEKARHRKEIEWMLYCP